MNADQFQSRLRWMANDKICVEVALTAASFLSQKSCLVQNDTGTFRG